jgi:glycogen operon protein
MAWHVFANTGVPSPDDIYEPGEEPLIENQQEVLVGPRSIIILVGKALTIDH